MTTPTSYTEATLAAYMHATLGDVASALGWASGTASYGEAVNETALAYGVDDITTITGRENIARLRALARAESWRQVMAYTAGDFDFSADGASYNRSQVHAQAKAALQLAEADAMRYGAYGFDVVVQNVRDVHDPYAYIPDDDRVLAP